MKTSASPPIAETAATKRVSQIKPFSEWHSLLQLAIWQAPLLLVLSVNIGVSVLFYWLAGHLFTLARRWWQQLPILGLAIWGVTQIADIREADFFILILVLLLPMCWRLEATNPVPRPLSPAGLTITIFLVGSVFIYQTQFIILLGMIAWLLSFLLWFTMALTGFRLTDLSVRWLPIIGLSAAAASLIVVMFILLPRIDTGFLPGLNDKKDQIRLVDNLDPGGMADLLEDDTVAFRAFPNRDHKSPPDYWRVFVLDREKDGQWTRNRRQGKWSSPSQIAADDKPDDYMVFTIAADRHEMRTLPIPGWPVDNARNYQLNQFGESRSADRYPNQSQQVITTGQTAVLLQSDMPQSTALSDANPQLQEWARSLRATQASDRDFINAVLAEFQNQFVYSTQIDLPRTDPLDHFFFTLRQGYCSTFATAMATILRAADIPAHVVTGYLGGSWNPYGDFWLVRNADAHAWVEAKLSDGVWLRFDPTLSVMPVSLQRFESLAEQGGNIRPQSQPLAPVEKELGLVDRARQVALWADAMNIRMTQAILQYGQTGETATNNRGLAFIFAVIAGFIGVVILGFFLIAVRLGRTQRAIPAQERRLERLLRPYIGQRAPSMSLPDYAERAYAVLSAEQAEAIRPIVALIYQMRFAPSAKAEARAMRVRLNKDLRRLSRLLSIWDRAAWRWQRRPKPSA